MYLLIWKAMDTILHANAFFVRNANTEPKLKSDNWWLGEHQFIWWSIKQGIDVESMQMDYENL